MEEVTFMYGSKENLKPVNEHIRDKRSRIGSWADFQADYFRSDHVSTSNQSDIPKHPKQDNKQSL